jgi:hypothetical protein
MSANQNIQGNDNAVDQNGGFVWNRLHSKRENIYEALLKEFRPSLVSGIVVAQTIARGWAVTLKKL